MPQYPWIDSPAAHARILEIEKEMRALAAERGLLSRVTGAPRVPRLGRPPLPDLLAEVMAEHPERAWSVRDVLDRLMDMAPDLASRVNASGLVSAALMQGCRGGHPRFTGGKGGRGKRRLYRLAGYRKAAGE